MTDPSNSFNFKNFIALGAIYYNTIFNKFYNSINFNMRIVKRGIIKIPIKFNKLPTRRQRVAQRVSRRLTSGTVAIRKRRARSLRPTMKREKKFIRNPWINFLREHRFEHRGKNAIAIAKAGSPVWRSMSGDQKLVYYQQAFKARPPKKYCPPCDLPPRKMN